ncbi:hypothetical protein [Egbenema bharatensis]|uniref:hypothetical protein n=1 Tax=Egbenema bharatensis TaxID=3463334 RepID=UPI003A8A24B6
MSSGMVGLSCYLVFVSWIGWNTWRKGSPILFAAFIAMLGFSSFHYVLRQPLFWFSILAIAESTLLTSKQNAVLQEVQQQQTRSIHPLKAIE